MTSPPVATGHVGRARVDDGLGRPAARVAVQRGRAHGPHGDARSVRRLPDYLSSYVMLSLSKMTYVFDRKNMTYLYLFL